ncbi:MAG: GNAT family N-acetyltransferase [Coriobacteriales bacterium]|nr:GNAT family N-acetyltransferase [Coriobacteriales bacterium]
MIRIELTSDLRVVYNTARYLAEVAPSFGVDEDKRNVLCFVVETALGNRLEQLGDSSERLVVEADEHSGEFVISITDKGVPYMPSSNQRRIFDNSKLGRLAFEQLGIDGQRVSICVRQAPNYVMPSLPEQQVEQLADTQVLCRRTTTSTDDILEAIRCLYEVYGYGYLHQTLYHTDQFRRLLKSGRYVSVLAENDHQQVLGHAALDEHEWFCGLREICNLVVKPLARGLGLSNRIVDYLVHIALDEGCGNLYALPVLHHPISQKLMNNAGLVPCGLLANLMDMSLIQGHEDDIGRASTAVCVRNVVQNTERVLYLPAECAGFVRGVLDEAHMSYEDGSVGCGDADPVQRTTRLSYTIDAVHSYVEAKVDAIGPDLYDQLASVYSRERGDQYQALVVYLNARDPHCPECYAYLREHEFLFTGCLPGARNGDYLLLEHFGGCGFNKDDVVAEPNYARMLEELYRINGM